MATKERHKGVRKGQESLIKGFEAGLTAEGIPDQHDDEINRVVTSQNALGQNGRVPGCCSRYPSRPALERKPPLLLTRTGLRELILE